MIVIEDLLKIKHTNRFEWTGVRVLQKVRASRSKVKLLRNSGMSIRISLGSLSLV